MLLTNFRELAIQNEACEDGMNYLNGWIKKHPEAKTTTDFLKAHKNIKKTIVVIYYEDIFVGFVEI